MCLIIGRSSQSLSRCTISNDGVQPYFIWTVSSTGWIAVRNEAGSITTHRHFTKIESSRVIDIWSCRCQTDHSEDGCIENLSCPNNEVVSLTLSGLKGLKTLDCEGNGLVSLDVSDCTSLSALNCHRNPLKEITIGITQIKTLAAQLPNTVYGVLKVRLSLGYLTQLSHFV